MVAMLLLIFLLLQLLAVVVSVRLRPSMTLRTATFGMGCFWGPQEQLSKLEGVSECIAGYTGGTETSPTYSSVCGGDTGHVEAVRVRFNDDVISLEMLLQIYLSHWRSQRNVVVSSIKRQYSPQVWLESESDIDAFRKLLTPMEMNTYGVSRLAPFYKAEEYHQNYEVKQRPRYLLLGIALVIDLLPNQDPLVYKVGAALTLVYIGVVFSERLLQGKVQEVT